MPPTTVEFLAEHRRERLLIVAEELVEMIQGANPAYQVDRVPREDLWRSCHDNVARILELLSESVRDGTSTRRDDDDPVYDAARATGARRARQGLPLDDVLRSFRFGGRLIWQDLIERGEDTLGASELREIGTRLWEVVDDTSAQVAIAYHQHERALVRADEQQKAELWEGVLSGRAREPGFAHEAARLLDLPVSADFLLVAALDLDERRADERLAPHGTAWARRTGGVVGLVALREADPAEPLAALADVAARQRVPTRRLAGGVRSGRCGRRVPAGHARAAGPGVDARRRVARRPTARGAAAQLADGRRASPRTLGRTPCWGCRRSSRDRCWRPSARGSRRGGSATRTAAVVPCHRNTVVNRLRRVSELTGTELLDQAPPVELDLALRAWRMGITGQTPPARV